MVGDSIGLSLGGYIYLFVLTFFLLIAVLFGVFAYRQIQRLRYNNVKKEINSRVAGELSKKSRDSINARIQAVFAFRATHFPKFTDCTLIAEHANSQHLNRMIAFDEIQRDMDRQLEFINPSLIREPGESTYAFLRRIRSICIPELKDTFIERLAFLHEWARYRTKPPFGEEQLIEVRELLKEFVRLLSKNHAALTSLNIKPNKSRSLEAKPNNSLGFRLKADKGFSLPERLPERVPLLMTQNEEISPRSSGIWVYNHTPGMDSSLESRPKLNFSQPIQIIRKHKIDHPHLSINSNFEKTPNPRRNFGDEPRITAAILPPPPLVTNSTRRNTDFDENKDKIQQIIEPIRSTTIQPTNISSISKNGTIDQSLKLNTTIQPIKSLKTTVSPTTKEGDFGDVVSSVWKKLKQVMGFSPPCHNGGHKNLRGLCECAKYFEGELCEQIICVNNGTKTRIKTIPQHDVCKCPHPQFISGNHCEYVHCANGGKDLGNGTCKCIDNWYSGQFCESYASSWLAVVGVPLICLAVIILCCIVCRLDLCPRRRSSRRGDRDRRRSYGNYQMPSRRTYANNPHRFHQPQPQQLLSHGITEQARMLQENLLNDAAFRRNTRSRSNDDPTVYRLETVPTYNPEILNNSNSDDYKLDVPPPTYEQAITRCPTIVPPNFGNSVLLPDYSPPRMSSSQSQSQTQRPTENG